MVAVSFHRKVPVPRRQSDNSRRIHCRKAGKSRCRPKIVKLIMDDSDAMSLARLFGETTDLGRRAGIADRISARVGEFVFLCEVRIALRRSR